MTIDPILATLIGLCILAVGIMLGIALVAHGLNNNVGPKW